VFWLYEIFGSFDADSLVCCSVGGSVDRACKLEALLRSLSYRRKELRIEQSKVDNQFIRLMNDLQLSLQNDEDLTVICAQAFADVPAIQEEETEDGGEDTGTATSKEVSVPVAAAPQPERNENVASDDKNSVVESEPDLPSTSRSGVLVCFASDVFSSDESRDDTRQILGSMSHPFLNNCTDQEHHEASAIFPSASHPSPSAMREGARAWRERQRQERGTSIDFKTGMSGHTALLSSHAHSHGYLEPSSSSGSHQDVFPKMSSHTGLAMIGNPLRGIFSSVMRSPSRTASQSEEMRHSGSM